MQILADNGYENKKTKRIILDKWGCKTIKKFHNYFKKLKIPHMGWNNLIISKNNNLHLMRFQMMISFTFTFHIF